MRARVLVVDDEPAGLGEIRRLLADLEVEVLAPPPGEDPVRLAIEEERRGHGFDVILIDYFAPRSRGAELVRQLAERRAEARVIVMAGHDPGEVAVEAMRLGAFDFIAMPLGGAELRLRVERALRDRSPPPTGNQAADAAKRRPRKSDVIIGGGGWIKDLYERISMVAPTDVTVAIHGESGTGKELVARTIHNLSARYERPFVVVNCAAIPDNLLEDELFGHVRGAFTDASRDRDGLFAAADGGTLFLDEIGEMPAILQVKILRVLQSQEFRRIGDDKDTRVDVRLITATHRDLEHAVVVGSFRQDLFYRINVFPVLLPPLRERREDVALLAHHFLLKHRGRVGKKVEGFTPAALSKLKAYDYPGNVRELENKIHHALVLVQGELIGAGDLQFGNALAPTLPTMDLSRPFRDLKREMVESFEGEYVRALLLANRGNLAAAARQADMDRKNLWAFVRKYKIDLRALRRRG